MRKGAMTAAERRARSRLTKMVQEQPLLRASLVTMARVCGNPNCKCAVKGEKHVSLYLAQRKEGKQRMLFVPRDWEERVKEWVGNYREVKQRLEEVCEEGWQRVVKRKE
jgi:hypothetical protein